MFNYLNYFFFKFFLKIILYISVFKIYINIYINNLKKIKLHFFILLIISFYLTFYYKNIFYYVNSEFCNIKYFKNLKFNVLNKNNIHIFNYNYKKEKISNIYINNLYFLNYYKFIII